jgi:hypothetical protein
MHVGYVNRRKIDMYQDRLIFLKTVVLTEVYLKIYSILVRNKLKIDTWRKYDETLQSK